MNDSTTGSGISKCVISLSMDSSHVLLVPSDDIQTSAVSHSDQFSVEVDSSIVSSSVASRSDVDHDLAATTLLDCSSHSHNSSLVI